MWRHCKGMFIVGGIVLFIFGIAALGLIMGYPVMLLWNWLMPGLFGLAKITFWQGIGLVILGHLLVGSPGFNKAHGRHRRFRHHNGGDECSCEDGLGKWRFYNKYWKEEGKAAFDAYIKKHEEEKKPE